MEKVCVLFVGFLCFSVGQSTTTDDPSTEETTSTLTDNWMMTSEPSTQQPDPSVITGLRIKVQSLVDLSSNSPEMDLLVRQLETFIPSEHKATTSITVRSIQKGSRTSQKHEYIESQYSYLSKVRCNAMTMVYFLVQFYQSTCMNVIVLCVYEVI